MYENLGTRVSEEIMKDIEFVAHEEKTDKSKVVRELLSEAVKNKVMTLALEKYAQKKISLGRAAELSKMPLVDFMKIASEKKIPVNYSIESLREDFRAIK